MSGENFWLRSKLAGRFKRFNSCVLSSCTERSDAEEQLALREGHTNWREGSQTGRVICTAGQTARGEATSNRPPSQYMHMRVIIQSVYQRLKCVILSQVFQADLTAKDDVIVRKNRELSQKNREIGNKDAQLAQKDGAISQKDRLLVQKDTLIADKEATIAERERALAEREALIQVARPAVTLCPTLVHLLCWLRCSLTCTGTQGTD